MKAELPTYSTRDTFRRSRQPEKNARRKLASPGHCHLQHHDSEIKVELCMQALHIFPAAATAVGGTHDGYHASSVTFLLSLLAAADSTARRGTVAPHVAAKHLQAAAPSDGSWHDGSLRSSAIKPRQLDVRHLALLTPRAVSQPFWRICHRVTRKARDEHQQSSAAARVRQRVH